MRFRPAATDAAIDLAMIDLDPVEALRSRFETQTAAIHLPPSACLRIRAARMNPAHATRANVAD